ncbi:protein EARLY FLOWERING 4-like [Lycium barbarum]|uniref:protein EARLY FLOWERING 4-like n=1 Tax=Lycium barbarum TaxID=112863 RepID=UPI00293F23AA|nr:protein EARLY FLOWERING 4-like [Lycium barbarum]
MAPKTYASTLLRLKEIPSFLFLHKFQEMEDTSNLNRHRQTLAKSQSRKSNKHRVSSRADSSVVESFTEENGYSMEEGDSQMWNNFSNNYRQVQSVLDQNRLLIQQVNENHQSRTHNSMVQNVGLIQELNDNISKVASLYSDFNTDFTTMVHQRKNGI